MGWDGKVLTDHRAMGWSGWVGKVLTGHKGIGLLDWDGKVLTDHRAVVLERSLQIPLWLKDSPTSDPTSPLCWVPPCPIPLCPRSRSPPITTSLPEPSPPHAAPKLSLWPHSRAKPHIPHPQSSPICRSGGSEDHHSPPLCHPSGPGRYHRDGTRDADPTAVHFHSHSSHA